MTTKRSARRRSPRGFPDAPYMIGAAKQTAAIARSPPAAATPRARHRSASGRAAPPRRFALARAARQRRRGAAEARSGRRLQRAVDLHERLPRTVVGMIRRLRRRQHRREQTSVPSSSAHHWSRVFRANAAAKISFSSGQLAGSSKSGTVAGSSCSRASSSARNFCSIGATEIYSPSAQR